MQPSAIPGHPLRAVENLASGHGTWFYIYPKRAPAFKVGHLYVLLLSLPQLRDAVTRKPLVVSGVDIELDFAQVRVARDSCDLVDGAAGLGEPDQTELAQAVAADSLARCPLPSRASWGMLAGMVRFLILTLAAIALAGCEKPDPEQAKFDKEFDRDAILVKTCRDDPTDVVGSPMRVYRFQDKLWFLEHKRRWRQIEAKPDNVCDLLDIDAAHRGKG